MKRIKNKGFTMIELLGVITLLGIIALICIPSVSKLLQNAGNSYYKAIEKNVKSAGTDYYTDNKDLLPDAPGKTALVYVGDKTNSKNSLVGLSYIEEVVDRNETTCGYYGENVLKSDTDEDYSYALVIREYKDEDRQATQFKYVSCMYCQGDNYKTYKDEYKYCEKRDASGKPEDEKCTEKIDKEYQSFVYCGDSYKPQNNKYIQAPKNYYLQISSFDYVRNILSNTKSDDNQSTRDYFEIRKAGVRNNDGEQQTNGQTAITIAPYHIDLIIDGKDVGDISSESEDKAWNSLVNQLQNKMGSTTFETYLKSHTVKLKLHYSYNYKLGEQEVERTAETYITLIKEVLQPAGAVTIESYYNDTSNELYYSSVPLEQTNDDGTYNYNYTYNVNHKNLDAKYQSLLSNTILNSSTYKGVDSISWINRGLRVNFKAEGASLFECSYDKNTWYPCESGESYRYTFNKDIYVRAISLYGNRGPINQFPIKIDMDDLDLKMSIDAPTGNNKWYIKDVTMKGEIKETPSKIMETKVCTTTNNSCDPLLDGKSIENKLNFTKVHSEETNNITYCYQAMNTAGSTSKKTCYQIKLDKTKPTCASVCDGSSTTWTNSNRTINCKGTDAGTSGLNPSYGNKSVTYKTDTKTAVIKYTLKDNAGNTTSCSSNVNVYVDKTAPTVPSLTMSRTTWTEENVVATASRSTDNLSGVKYYEYEGNDPNQVSGQQANFSFTKEVKKGSIRFRAVDYAGNKSSWSSRGYAYIDRTPPTCNTTSSANGWTNKAVILTGTCVDSGSGCKQNRVTKTISAGSNKNYSDSPGIVYDNVGHATTCASVNVKIDVQAPSCGSCSGGSTTWTNQDRTITCTGVDNGESNLKSSGKTVTYSSTKKTATINYTVTDNAGNSTSCSKNVNVYVDKTKPSCGSCSGQSTSWTKSNRTITCTGSDSDSGLDASYKGISHTYNSGTTKKGSLTYTVKDKAGNQQSCKKEPSVYVDKDKPTISSITLYNQDTCKNSFGVSAKYSVSDNGGSGVSHVEDYWGQNNEDFQSSFLGRAVNRGASTNITSAYGTACYSAGNPATKGAHYYIKIYAKDNAGNELYYHTGTAQANG